VIDDGANNAESEYRGPDTALNRFCSSTCRAYPNPLPAVPVPVPMLVPVPVPGPTLALNVRLALERTGAEVEGLESEVDADKPGALVRSIDGNRSVLGPGLTCV
jgi:hypothetical protein